ncbi:MAG: hypothetical protein A2X49_05710 [Lentisphaerae bacterium GWF2_52_8]|nr:MAG: hypothetical protein A2X49_05710 [Lentisphaerae bacterium GWF2_52_8]
MSTKNKIGKSFSCLRCGACCRWKGPVRVTEAEIDALAVFLKMDSREFIERYSVLTSDRRGLSLTEGADGICVFYDPESSSCLVQEVKPKQCREFPFSWNFPGWEKECLGAAAGK